MKTIGFISLGCPKNQVDTEVMLGLLRQAGYEIVPEEEAEILVVNTCGFIQSAKEEAIETTLQAAHYKEHGNCRALIMAGCFSQRYAEELVQEMPEVDVFMGLDDVPNIVAICQSLEKNVEDRVAENFSPGTPSVYLYNHDMPRLRIGHAHTAYLKIAEGCRYHCSFCAIPMIRGTLRSRKLESVIQEAAILAEQGVKEIILIAQDTTSYGLDRYKKQMIVPLLEQLSQVKGIEWIRLMYAYPNSIEPSLMRFIASESTICPYLDLPLQHIDDDILKVMRRPITESETRRLIEHLRQEIPGLTLRTSLIAGFPGETEQAFQKLEDFVRDVRFERLGVFTYSHEEGTPAYDLPNQVPVEIAGERQQRLMQIQTRISLEKHQALVGTRQTVLIDGESEETPLLLEGRMQGQAPDIDGVVYINEGDTEQGQFEEVLITEAFPHDLVGKIV